MACKGCTDCFFGGVKVGPKGPVDSPFVIVGESPGALEIGQGLPFVGPSGELVESVLQPLRDAGILDIEPYWTNAMQCMPRQKDPGRLAKACERCQDRLLDELELFPRKVILALGNAAIWSLTNNFNHKITQVRGNVFASNFCEKGIVATVHPSFLLRGGGNLGQFKRDIALAVSMLRDMDISAVDAGTGTRNIQAVSVFKPAPYKILSSESEVMQLARTLKDVKFAASDLETDSFNPRKTLEDINLPSYYGYGILCGGICFEDNMSYVIPGELMRDELYQNDVQWTWHNGKFDTVWGRNKRVVRSRDHKREYIQHLPSIKVVQDTMLMSYSLNERGGIHDLEQVGADWCQAPNYKAMLEQYLPSTKHSYAVIPEDVLYKYQGIDTNLTYHIAKAMLPKIDADKHLTKMYNRILIPGSEFLMNVENRGFHVDKKRVQENEEVIGSRCAVLEEQFKAIAANHGFKDINIRSWQQLQRFLYGKDLSSSQLDALKLLGITPLRLAPSSWGTDEDTLAILPKHPAVEILMEYRTVHKQFSTYIKPAKEKTERDGRMHCNFKLHGTTTGRLSSNAPNMQNIPRDPQIRGQFVAPPGRAILEVDLSQAELRVLAHLSNDQVMLAIFNSGLSLHDELATFLFGAGWNKEQKMIAKNINFGIIYGITAAGLKEQVMIGAAALGSNIHVTMKEAQEWIDGWAARFPQAWAYIEKCRSAPIHGQTMVTLFGRKRRFGVVSRERLRELQNEAANFPEQSHASDITLNAGIELDQKLIELYDCRIVNTVHDCLVNDLPDDMSIIIPAARLIMSTMERVACDWGLTKVPFKAEAEIGYRWGNCKTVHVEDFDRLELMKGVTNGQAIGTIPVYT